MSDGANLMAKGEKKLKGGVMSFFSGGARYDEASDLFQQAANQFKLQKEWQEASQALVRCSQCQEQMGNTSEQATFLMEAGHVLKKVSTNDAVQHYTKAVSLYQTTGRFSQAAKIMKSVAELYEQDNDFTEAIKHYRKAADLFEMEEYGKSQITACLLKVAEFTSKYEGNLDEAIKIYEKEGEKALSNQLIQFGAKEHFLKAGILHLAKGDTVDAMIACEKYEATDTRFSQSREGNLLRSLVEAVNQNDIDAFVEAINEYDNITRLDAWKTNFLFQIREKLSPSGGGDGEGGGAPPDLT